MAYGFANDARVRVIPVTLACCSVEVSAAIDHGMLVPLSEPALAGQLSVLLVAGTVTQAMAPAVHAAWAALPEPRAAVAFGACASSGGPYWDAPSVLPGSEALIPVSRFVPGCPPRPEAIIEALASLADEVAR